MTGKLIVHGPDEDMGRSKYCAIFLDGEKCATLRRGDVFTTNIEKDCNLQTQEYNFGIPISLKSEPYLVKAYMSTELDLAPGLYTPVERQLIVMDKEAKDKEDEEKAAIERVRADLITWLHRERRIRCNVCGHIFCYNLDDIKYNSDQAFLAKLSAIGGLAAIVGGSRYDMYEQNKSIDRHLANIKDFSRCPHCNSTNIEEIAEEETRATPTAPSSVSPEVNVVEELKKYKELLDMGILTQEEFAAKKKQLLGL